MFVFLKRSRRLVDAPSSRGKLIAIVGADGSGKSSLTTDITRQLSKDYPVQRIYLGLGSGDLGRRIGNLPVIGPWLETRLTRKAKTTHAKGEKVPGFLTALVAYLFSVKRFVAFSRMIRTLRAGTSVITDRFPQVEIPGSCDGPILRVGKAPSGPLTLLVRLEGRLYRRMTALRPDLVVRLDVAPEIAQSRKPDHDLAAIRAKTDVMRRLGFGGAPLRGRRIKRAQIYGKGRQDRSGDEKHLFLLLSLPKHGFPPSGALDGSS